MKKLKNLVKSKNNAWLTYAIVVVAYIVMAALKASGALSSKMSGMLVPICVYVAMALSLNLTVGIIGELSLGHAGIMAIGAFKADIKPMVLVTTPGSGT